MDVPGPSGRRPAQEGGDGLDGVGAALGVRADEADPALLGQVAVGGAQPLARSTTSRVRQVQKPSRATSRSGLPVPCRTYASSGWPADWPVSMERPGILVRVDGRHGAAVFGHVTAENSLAERFIFH